MRNIALVLSLMLVFVIPFENLVMGEDGGTISRALGLAVAGFWVATVIVTGRMRRPRPFHFVVFLFVAWNALSAIWSWDVDRTLVRVVTYVQQLGLVLILWDLYTTPMTLRIALQAYVLGAYLSVLSTVYNYLEGSEFYHERYAATGFNPNDLGVILALGIPTAWHLATSGDGAGARQLPLRVLNLAYIPLSVFAIFLTASRGTLVAVAASCIYIAGSLPRLRLSGKVAMVAASVAVLYALQGLVPEASVDRITGMGLDFNGRLTIWTEGLAVFAESPLVGVGSGAFKSAIDANKSPHNFVISLLGEVGLLGFALFCLLLLQAALVARRQPPAHARYWLTILMVWAIGSAFEQFEQRKQTWLFLGLAVVSGAIHGRRDDQAVADPLLLPSLHLERKGV
jgi:O-antigen ligase